MEQFIGCDAHKKFSVFVAVNEKGHAGEALRVAHDSSTIRPKSPWAGIMATKRAGESAWPGRVWFARAAKRRSR